MELSFKNQAIIHDKTKSINQVSNTWSNDVLDKKTSNKNTVEMPSFRANGYFYISDKLESANDIKKYKKIKKALNNKDVKNLEILLNNKILTQKNSNDGSSTLNNLYNIIEKPRESHLESEKILKYTVRTLANPFIINQKFGKLKNSSVKQSTNSSTCPTACVEFDLAESNPAEFARYVEKISSPEKSVKVKLNFSAINSDMLEAIDVLNQFNADYESIDFDTFEITLKPDDNAYIRANNQEDNHKPNHRTPVDVLLQSTFLNLGSRGTYDSLTDTRTPYFNESNEGLVSSETAFLKSIVNNKSSALTNVLYQNIDDNLKLTEYLQDFKTTENQLGTILNSGKNVIVGITYLDSDKSVLGGHEITLDKYKKDSQGNGYFLYQDSDDDLADKPVKIYASELIPMIHHAMIYDEMLPTQENTVKYPNLSYYKDLTKT